MRASLRAEYGIDLDEPGVSVRALAELTSWLPPGCPLWISVGGPLALTTQQREARVIELRLRELMWRQAGAKGQRPQPQPEPPYAHERDMQAESIRRKADAYLRRQRARSTEG